MSVTRELRLAGGTALPTLNGQVEHTTWHPVDLTDALTGIDVPPPTLLARTDGVRLLYPGRTHQFAGESESCKTWAALLAAIQILDTGKAVLWIDFEDEAAGIVSRLRSLGAGVDPIKALFTYIRPDEPLMNRDLTTAGGIDFGNVLQNQYQLAVVDGVTEAMVTESLDLMSNSDVATWMRRVPKRIATATGAAVVVIDHVTKSTEGRGRYALGGQHKLAGLTGAAYSFNVTKRLSRATTDPVEAAVTITVNKDRPGHVRAHAAGEDCIGILELTAWPDGGLTAAIVPMGAANGTPDLALVTRIVEFLGQYDGATKNTITSEVEGKTDPIRLALRWMAEPERAWITIERVGQSHRHHLTETGKAYFT